MDPKGLSEFIARHGEIVGVDPIARKGEFNGEPDRIGYRFKFANQATVDYYPAEYGPDGQELKKALIFPDASKPATEEGKATSQVTIQGDRGSRTEKYDASGKVVGTDITIDNRSKKTDLTPGQAADDEVKTQELEERRRNSAKYGIPFTDVQLADWLKDGQKYADARDDKARAEARQAQQDKQELAQREFENSLKLDANRRANREGVIDLGDGRKGAIEYNPDGTVKQVRDVTPKTDPGPQKPFPQGKLLGQFGQVLVQRQQELIDDVASGKMTNDQAEKEMTRYKDIMNSLVSEQVGIANLHKSVYDTDVRQRGDTLQDDTSRRSYATQAMKQVYDIASENASYMPASMKGQGFMGAALRGGMGLALQMADAMGALKQRNEIQKSAALMTLMGAQLPGVESSQSAVSGPSSMASSASGTPGGQPIININVPGAGGTPGGFAGMGGDQQQPQPQVPDPNEEDVPGARTGFSWA